MAGHKGYAIAAAMDMLSGVLSGSEFLSGVHGPYTDKRSGVGHFILAMNIEAFQPLAQFSARMERFIGELKAVPLAQGSGKVLYLGELGHARRSARDRSGERRALSLAEAGARSGDVADHPQPRTRGAGHCGERARRGCDRQAIDPFDDRLELLALGGGDREVHLKDA